MFMIYVLCFWMKLIKITEKQKVCGVVCLGMCVHACSREKSQRQIAIIPPPPPPHYSERIYATANMTDCDIIAKRRFHWPRTYQCRA